MTKYNDIPEDAIEHAKRMILDSIGVTLAAIDTDSASIVRKTKAATFEHGGPARVPGTTLSGLPSEVALLTGTMAHALDFDDVHHRMGGHPSTPVLSALLPVAERISASGQDLLQAFLLGTEVEIRLADTLNPGHYERGWHPTAVLGTLGAAAAVGDLLDLKVQQLRQAIGIAASKASGIKGNFGTMTKPLHVGTAARNGLEAAELAGNEFTASERILETEFGGFCDLFEGTPGYDFDNHLDRLGMPWGVLDPPVGFKPYPCCGSTHSAIDAALALQHRHSWDPNAIRTVRIAAHPRRLDHTNEPTPLSPLDAKFSVQYCVTVALHEGNVWLDHFTSDAVTSRRYQSFLDVVEIELDREIFEDREWGARVTIETNDGQHVVEIDAPTGSGEDPMTRDDLIEKYRQCAAKSCPDAEVESSLSTLLRIEELNDVNQLLDDLV